MLIRVVTSSVHGLVPLARAGLGYRQSQVLLRHSGNQCPGVGSARRRRASKRWREMSKGECGRRPPNLCTNRAPRPSCILSRWPGSRTRPPTYRGSRFSDLDLVSNGAHWSYSKLDEITLNMARFAAWGLPTFFCWRQQPAGKRNKFWKAGRKQIAGPSC